MSRTLRLCQAPHSSHHPVFGGMPRSSKILMLLQPLRRSVVIGELKLCWDPGVDLGQPRIYLRRSQRLWLNRARLDITKNKTMKVAEVHFHPWIGQVYIHRLHDLLSSGLPGTACSLSHAETDPSLLPPAQTALLNLKAGFYPRPRIYRRH